eukprot:Nk52_evm21s163 gene=Nk52_evmTU21s163
MALFCDCNKQAAGFLMVLLQILSLSILVHSAAVPTKERRPWQRFPSSPDQGTQMYPAGWLDWGANRWPSGNQYITEDEMIRVYEAEIVTHRDPHDLEDRSGVFSMQPIWFKFFLVLQWDYTPDQFAEIVEKYQLDGLVHSADRLGPFENVYSNQEIDPATWEGFECETKGCCVPRIDMKNQAYIDNMDQTWYEAGWDLQRTCSPYYVSNISECKTLGLTACSGPNDKRYDCNCLLATDSASLNQNWSGSGADCTKILKGYGNNTVDDWDVYQMLTYAVNKVRRDNPNLYRNRTGKEGCGPLFTRHHQYIFTHNPNHVIPKARGIRPYLSETKFKPTGRY